MRARPVGIALVLGAGACNSPPATQPQSENVVNATLSDQQIADEAANYGEGSIAPAERDDIQAVNQLQPGQVATLFANLLNQKKFDEAFQFVDSQAMGVTAKQFEDRFGDYKTIHAAIGEVGRTEGAAGSLYSEVQLTLSGNRRDGSPYVITGPVTLRRVNDVPGSTAEQRRWRIVKMELTDRPRGS